MISDIHSYRSRALSPTACTLSAGSELRVVRVPRVAVVDLVQAVDASLLGLVPEAPREQRLVVVAVLFPRVRCRAKGLEELLGADFGVPERPTASVDVEALRDLLAGHALAALLDRGMMVLKARLGVLHWVLRRIVRLDRVVQVLDGLHARRIIAAARGSEARLEALLQVLATGGEGVDLHGVDVDGPRDRRVIGVARARLHRRLKERRSVEGLVDAAHRALGRTRCAALLPAGGAQEAGLLAVMRARALVLLEARAVRLLERRG